MNGPVFEGECIAFAAINAHDKKLEHTMLSALRRYPDDARTIGEYASETLVRALSSGDTRAFRADVRVRETADRIGPVGL